jgi:hypothetical protein
MRKSDKLKNIESLNKKLLGESFDPDRYQETADRGYNELSKKSTILNLAESYADDMWREGAQGGFAPR